MAFFDFQITDQNIGEVIGPPDGFVVSLKMVTQGILDGPPRWDYAKRHWESGYFVLRGSRDIRDLYCSETRSTYYPGSAIDNSSIGYKGGLIVVCVPAKSVWALTLSDIPNLRRAPGPEQTRPGNFGSYPDWRHTKNWPVRPREERAP